MTSVIRYMPFNFLSIHNFSPLIHSGRKNHRNLCRGRSIVFASKWTGWPLLVEVCGCFDPFSESHLQVVFSRLMWSDKKHHIEFAESLIAKEHGQSDFWVGLNYHDDTALWHSSLGLPEASINWENGHPETMAKCAFARQSGLG